MREPLGNNGIQRPALRAAADAEDVGLLVVFTAMSWNDTLNDLKAADGLSDYEAVEVLWVALLKAANTMPGNNEHQRMLALFSSIPSDKLSECLNLPGVDTLINLQPPLETVLADPNERLEPARVAQAIKSVRDTRSSDPRGALIALGEVLKRIRNKRSHGFKSRSGLRDAEILGGGRQILGKLCEIAVAQLKSP